LRGSGFSSSRNRTDSRDHRKTDFDKLPGLFYPAKMHGSRISRRHLVSLTTFILLSTVAVAQNALDSDNDGLSDQQEQALLEQFRPEFMISASDCAVRPSSFEPGHVVPSPVAADGTIYGQVFPVVFPGVLPAHGSNYVEIHYYMLWDRDCGRRPHPLDVEHVSAIVSNQTGSNPQALYWYAAAHENTACDISSGARAGAIAAEQHGPVVWSSGGKHALYLRKSMCHHGCGADSCDDDVELAQNGPVINIGEMGAPANGAVWAASPQWFAADKMDSDFSADTITTLSATAGDTIVTLRGNSSLRGAIQGSGTVLDSTEIGARHTGAALDTADNHTSKSLDKAVNATSRSLKRALRFVFGKH
jgi:hypothetical protein